MAPPSPGIPPPGITPHPGTPDPRNPRNPRTPEPRTSPTPPTPDNPGVTAGEKPGAASPSSTPCQPLAAAAPRNPRPRTAPEPRPHRQAVSLARLRLQVDCKWVGSGSLPRRPDRARNRAQSRNQNAVPSPEKLVGGLARAVGPQRGRRGPPPRRVECACAQPAPLDM